jgi:hypothetical protein
MKKSKYLIQNSNIKLTEGCKGPALCIPPSSKTSEFYHTFLAKFQVPLADFQPPKYPKEPENGFLGSRVSLFTSHHDVRRQTAINRSPEQRTATKQSSPSPNQLLLETAVNSPAVKSSLCSRLVSPLLILESELLFFTSSRSLPH